MESPGRRRAATAPLAPAAGAAAAPPRAEPGLLRVPAPGPNARSLGVGVTGRKRDVGGGESGGSSAQRGAPVSSPRSRLQSPRPHAGGGKTSRLPLPAGRGGSPPSVGHTGAPRRGERSPTPLRVAAAGARPPALCKRGLARAARPARAAEARGWFTRGSGASAARGA